MGRWIDTNLILNTYLLILRAGPLNTGHRTDLPTYREVRTNLPAGNIILGRRLATDRPVKSPCYQPGIVYSKLGRVRLS